MKGRFVHLDEKERPSVTIMVDGKEVSALEGDTLMVAILNSGLTLRSSEFGDGHRAGFCLMGACQDCWVWTREGGRLRSCSTFVTAGLDILTNQPEATWPNRA